MTNKDLKKFTRKELLEVLVYQGKEIERLQNELRLANEKLGSRELCMKNAGSIAEAALSLNHIFQDADEAGKQYVASIKKMAQIEQEKLKAIEQKEKELRSILEKIQNKNDAAKELPFPSFERRDIDES